MINNEKQQRRFIVDKDVTDGAIEDISENLTSALFAAGKFYEKTVATSTEQPNIKIKVASNLYEESTLTITTPGLVIEPKEKGGEVTLVQEMEPCIVVDIGQGNTLSLKNVRFIMRADYCGKLDNQGDERAI